MLSCQFFYVDARDQTQVLMFIQLAFSKLSPQLLIYLNLRQFSLSCYFYQAGFKLDPWGYVVVVHTIIFIF